MPDIPQLVAAIDSRLAEIAAEIAALDSAKAQLAARRPSGPARAVTDGRATRSRRRAPRTHLTPPPQQPTPAAGRRASTSVEAARDGETVVTQQRSTRRAAPTSKRVGPSVGGVRAEMLERLLADASAGLSANAIAKQAGAGYARTLKLLHELQAAGQVRRSGARRSTVWQLITDEERIAERAAELERLRGAPSRRRGSARAS